MRLDEFLDTQVRWARRLMEEQEEIAPSVVLARGGTSRAVVLCGEGAAGSQDIQTTARKIVAAARPDLAALVFEAWMTSLATRDGGEANGHGSEGAAPDTERWEALVVYGEARDGAHAYRVYEVVRNEDGARTTSARDLAAGGAQDTLPFQALFGRPEA